MPKAEKGTPKDIANRMKAKGLQKLKFYCQMCSKQCRDENGFKCHLTSDSHLRNMKVFRDNASGILDDFSSEFEKVYVDTLRRRHGTQRMNANNVYQEVIMDKHHIHMNSTKWATLTDFVQYLGKKGICVVEETERGWYVTYIERDPALLARQEALQKKAEADRREEKLANERREVLRMEAAKALDRAGGVVERVASEIGRTRDKNNIDGDQKMIEMKLLGATTSSSLSSQPKKKRKGNSGAKLLLVEEDDDDGDDDTNQVEGIQGNEIHPKMQTMTPTSKTTINSSRKELDPRNNYESVVDRSEKKKKKHKSDKKYNDDSNNNPKKDDCWLYRDIIVRIINKKLSDGQYYKRKAIVDKVIDKYEAEVEVLESSRRTNDGGGDLLRLDQDDLETVVPKELGEKVRILVGKYRGRKARVVRLNKAEYMAELRLTDDDKVITLNYEDFSMLA